MVYTVLRVHWCQVLYITVLLSFPSLTRCAVIEIISRRTKEVVYSFEDKDTVFSPSIDQLKSYSNKTYIATANPHDACSSLKRPPDLYSVHYSNEKNDQINWIVVAQASGCSFYVKARNAKKAGYSTIFIYGDDTSTVTDNEYRKDSTINIIVILEEMALQLKEKYTYPQRFYVKFNENIPSFFSKFTSSIYYICDTAYLLFSLLWTIVTHWSVQCVAYGSMLYLLFCWLLYYCADYPFRLRHHFPTLEPYGEYIIKTMKWSPEERERCCAICFDEFTQNEELSLLPCSHYFHKSCIFRWLTRVSGNRNCPMCRSRVPTDRDRLYEQSLLELQANFAAIVGQQWLQQQIEEQERRRNVLEVDA